MSAVPDRYRGVWRRTLLEGSQRAADRESTVLWLQTAYWHADLRLPPRRPSFAGIADVAATTPAQRAWLATQEGFSGITEVVGDVCQWHRDVDFQPASGARDIGTMTFHDDDTTLEEYGVDADYHETWQRLPESAGPAAVWHSRNGPALRLLLAGDCFILVRPRSRPLPSGASLASLAATQPAHLDFELSYGRIGSAAVPWQIVHSTLPWREGTSLAPVHWSCVAAEPGAPAPPAA